MNQKKIFAIISSSVDATLYQNHRTTQYSSKIPCIMMISHLDIMQFRVKTCMLWLILGENIGSTYSISPFLIWLSKCFKITITPASILSLYFLISGQVGEDQFDDGEK